MFLHVAAQAMDMGMQSDEECGCGIQHMNKTQNWVHT